MSWRIDVELGRRSLASTVKPAYMIRMDVLPANASAETGDHTDASEPAGTQIESIHMEASYASLKNLQKELERAVDELAGVKYDLIDFIPCVYR
jgi:putative aminopeptidase FrvX